MQKNSFKDILKDTYSEKELEKLNIVTTELITAPKTSVSTIYERGKVKSEFYNSIDIHDQIFYKKVSLIFPANFYDK